MEINELNKLKAKLPKGWAKSIADAVGKSKPWVYKVMSGDEEDLAVIDTAIALAVKAKEESDKRKKLIEAL